MISIKASLSNNLPDYEAIFARFVTLAPQKIRRRMREKLHEDKHGQLYSRNSGSDFTRSHRASAKGESPAGDTGALERSLKIVRLGMLETAIESNLGYADILEDEMDRPLWEASVDELIPELTNDLYRMMV